MKKAVALTASALLVLALGCKAKEAVDQAAISADLDKRGTTELLNDAAEDSYNPPADEKLTPAQIEMYLKVREKEKAIAKVAKAEMKQHAATSEKSGEKSLAGMMEGFKALGSAADLFTADIRAAKDLGINTAEYQWVKAQVLEASGAEMASKMAQTTQSMLDSAYVQTKKQYDEAKDETSKKMLGEMLAGYEKSRQEAAAQQKADIDPATEYNRQLLSRYENALNAIATEFSKFEDKEGEAQKGVEEWQKQLETAAKEAQAQSKQ